MGKDKRPHNYLKIAEESETGKKLKAFLPSVVKQARRREPG